MAAGPGCLSLRLLLGEEARWCRALWRSTLSWFFWSDASVNVAAAGTPGIDFVPPTLEVQNADGQWVPAGPPLGFPAGKTKTMVNDITSMIPEGTPRFRISSTLELYWDSILLAVCDDDAEFKTTSLEPVSTDLWSRGFSEPIMPDRQDMPLFFDWSKTTEEPRWDQHPGLSTRYGAVDELLTDSNSGSSEESVGRCRPFRTRGGIRPGAACVARSAPRLASAGAVRATHAALFRI
ncbi:MAG: hypothetical protein ACI8WY_001232 [Planctomycetota bacterium]|jgi:hypothetical protein